MMTRLFRCFVEKQFIIIQKLGFGVCGREIPNILYSFKVACDYAGKVGKCFFFAFWTTHFVKVNA
jgi:hypothetical protein